MSKTDFNCPSCGSTLKYKEGSDALICQSCGSQFSIEQINASKKQNEGGGFDWSDYKKNIQSEKMTDTRVYNCTNCGAIIESEETTIATTCPFCDSNVVLDDRATGGLKPNNLIPFQIKKEDFPGILKKFYKNKKLLPNDFFTQSVLEKTQGVYVPFWLFDATLDGKMVISGKTTRHYSQGDYNVTETKYYALHRDGKMSFARIPVDASVKMDNDLMDSIEPYDYSGLKPFTNQYLSGFVADRFDSSPDDELPRASRRMVNSAWSVMKDTCSGYSGLSLIRNDMKLVNPNVNYTLLPVYLMNCKYKDKNYQYAINGQTGKMVGHLPISKLKYWLYFLRAFLIGGAIGFIFSWFFV